MTILDHQQPNLVNPAFPWFCRSLCWETGYLGWSPRAPLLELGTGPRNCSAFLLGIGIAYALRGDSGIVPRSAHLDGSEKEETDPC